MASTTPTPTQTTAEKMQFFISTFKDFIAAEAMLLEWELEVEFVPPTRFPRGMKYSAAYPYAQTVVEELQEWEEPRLQKLEPLCKLPDDEVNRVGENDKELLTEYLDKKKQVRSWRKRYFILLSEFIELYNRTWSRSDELYNRANSRSTTRGVEHEFFANALDRANDKDLSFCLNGLKIGRDVQLRD